MLKRIAPPHASSRPLHPTSKLITEPRDKAAFSSAIHSNSAADTALASSPSPRSFFFFYRLTCSDLRHLSATYPITIRARKLQRRPDPAEPLSSGHAHIDLRHLICRPILVLAPPWLARVPSIEPRRRTATRDRASALAILPPGWWFASRPPRRSAASWSLRGCPATTSHLPSGR